MENQNVDASAKLEAYNYAQKFLRVAIEFHKNNPDVLSPTQAQYGKDFPDNYELMYNIRIKDFLTTDSTKKLANYGFIAREKFTNNYVIAIRGTQTIAEGVIDEEIALVPWAAVPQAGKVEEGFANLYATLHLLVPGSEDTKDKIMSLYRFSKITMIGHSLGSSLVTLYGTHLATELGKGITIYTLASPKTGDQDFVNYYNTVIKDGNSYRFFNTRDKVPNEPQNPKYQHVPASFPLYPDFNIKDTDKCNHWFDTYLYLLDGGYKAAILDPECRA